MNYYERHLGDYARDTKWLTTYQHGVYTLLLDWYYTNERAIPVDLIYRIVAARSGPEKRATDEVISSFFDVTKQAGFAHNKRADFDLAKYECKREANSLKAKKRWDATAMPPAMPGQCPDDAIPVTSNQTPVTSRKAKTPVVPAGDSEAEVVRSTYNRLLPKCQQATVLNDKRLKRIKVATKLARHVCEGQGWEYTPAEFWEAYFTECSHDAWMRGEVPNPKNPAWVQNIDVLLAEDRFAWVMDKAIAAMRAGE